MTGTRFSKILKLATNKEFTHVSIALDEGLNELYSFGRKHLTLPFIAGFVKEGIDKGVFKKYDTSCEVLELDITPEQFKLVKDEITKYINAYDKYRYNLIGLPFMWFDIPYERKNHFVCSQFVASVLTFSGVYEFEKSWTLIRPMDFKYIENIKTIYKGKLQSYRERKHI